MDLGSAVSWFQSKIGTYDKANWEVTVEKKETSVLQDLQKLQLKAGNVRPDLIDVDLIRGSTFTKAKPGYHWTQVTKKGFLKVLLFPLFYSWWTKQTSLLIWILFSHLYLLQLVSVGIYLFHQSQELKEISPTEAFGPVLIMFILGQLYIHVISTNFTRPSHREKRKHKHRRKKRQGGTSRHHGITETIAVTNEKEAVVLDTTKENPENKENEEPCSNLCNSSENGKIPNNLRARPVGETSSSSSGDESSSSSTSSISESEGSPGFLEENPFEPPALSRPSECEEQKTSYERRRAPTEEAVVVSIWDGNGFSKARLTLLEISSAIVHKVESHRHGSDYVSVVVFSSLLITALPIMYRLYQGKSVTRDSGTNTESISILQIEEDLSTLEGIQHLLGRLLGRSYETRVVVVINLASRLVISFSLFFLLCVAERAYKSRYLYAKYFGALTSTRRARRNGLPHFRLSKVRHIKMWLSLRSFLKKRGPQRSVDTIISCTLLLGIVLVVTTCVKFIQFSENSEKDHFLLDFFNWEVSAWCMVIGIFLMRFTTLGAEINRKYRNNSILLTEQINLYLQMEHSPHKKEELVIANNVLKLASKLLKELESPFKVSGLIMNPLLSNITRVIVLSLFSGVMSDLLGFRLKLWKIKAT